MQVPTFGAVPSPRKGASLIVSDNGRRMYLFGGHDGTATLNDVHVLEVERFSWSLMGMLGTAPAGREAASMGIAGNLLVVAGGRALQADGGWRVCTDVWVAHLAKCALLCCLRWRAALCWLALVRCSLCTNIYTCKGSCILCAVAVVRVP